MASKYHILLEFGLGSQINLASASSAVWVDYDNKIIAITITWLVFSTNQGNRLLVSEVIFKNVIDFNQVIDYSHVIDYRHVIYYKLKSITKWNQ